LGVVLKNAIYTLILSDTAHGKTMSKFKIFNIQLLPFNDEKEVGVSGYKKLFAELRDINQKHLKAKTHLDFHYQVSSDIYMGPLDFKTPPGYVTGHFVRYRNTEVVTDLATGKALYYAKAGKGGATNIRVVPFVFNAEKHYFAIDGALGIRTPDFISALEGFLWPIVREYFPRYQLTVNLISKRNELENVFRTAESYKTVKIHLNGPNGSDAVDILGDMRDNKMQTLDLHVSGGDGRMTGLPSFVKQILRSVIGHGWSVITYFVRNREAPDERGRMQTYDSREQPLTFVVRHSPANSSEDGFMERVTQRLSSINPNVEDYVDADVDVDGNNSDEDE
jgi:hypothetical protein